MIPKQHVTPVDAHHRLSISGAMGSASVEAKKNYAKKFNECVFYVRPCSMTYLEIVCVMMSLLFFF